MILEQLRIFVAVAERQHMMAISEKALAISSPSSIR